MKAVPLGRSGILSAVGCHRTAHGVKGAAEKHGYLGGGGNGGDVGSTQTVDGGLYHDAANGGDGVLEAHGQTHDAEFLRSVGIPPPVPLFHPQNRVAAYHPQQASRPGQSLGNDGSQRRTEYVQLENQNEYHIQDNIDQGGRNLPYDRCAAVPKGAKNPRGKIIEEAGRKSHENGENIAVGPLVDVRRSVHACKNDVAEERCQESHNRAKNDAEPYAHRDIAAQLLMVPGAELLGHRNCEAAADTGAEADYQEIDGARGAYRRQGRTAEGLAHNSGVRHVIKLLEQISEQNRDTKAENQPHGTALCQIFCHGALPFRDSTCLTAFAGSFS